MIFLKTQNSTSEELDTSGKREDRTLGIVTCRLTEGTSLTFSLTSIFCLIPKGIVCFVDLIYIYGTTISSGAGCYCFFPPRGWCNQSQYQGLSRPEILCSHSVAWRNSVNEPTPQDWLFFWDWVLLCSPNWLGTGCVDQVSLRFTGIQLHLPPEYWD